MSILIKGMEMPTEQYGKMVITLYPNGHVAEYIGDIGRVWEAVPVPSHGRLIDADALLDAWDDNHTIPSAAAKVIEKTIIPAEPPKDEAPAGPYDLLYEEGGYNSNGV